MGQLEEETGSANSAAHCGTHKVPFFDKDFRTLLEVLTQEKVLQPHQERLHPTFKFKKGLLQQKNYHNKNHSTRTFSTITSTIAHKSQHLHFTIFLFEILETKIFIFNLHIVLLTEYSFIVGDACFPICPPVHHTV